MFCGKKNKCFLLLHCLYIRHMLEMLSGSIPTVAFADTYALEQGKKDQKKKSALFMQAAIKRDLRFQKLVNDKTCVIN